MTGQCLGRLENGISTWPQITVHPHRFGGREFRFGAAEVGHIHTGGIVGISAEGFHARSGGGKVASTQ